MLSIQSVESLMLAIPKDVLEDIVARKIVEANMAGVNQIILSGIKWNNPELLKTLQDKGYRANMMNSSRELIINWD